MFTKQTAESYDEDNCISCKFFLKIERDSFTSTSTSIFITLVKSVQTSHQPTRVQSEKTTERLEIILRSILIKKWARNVPTTIMKIIVKADRGKAIA